MASSSELESESVMQIEVDRPPSEVSPFKGNASRRSNHVWLFSHGLQVARGRGDDGQARPELELRTGEGRVRQGISSTALSPILGMPDGEPFS